MFQKILIANRGEIACRVIDTARKLGVRTVAVYSDADRGARHVSLADEAVHIGGPAPRDSYLRGDVIIQAALDTGAEAIHPGYGFLSENPDFVDAVTAAGLVFIGPSASAIRKMGLKDAAKALMAEAGVPVVPGYHGENQDPAHLQAQADAIGYPVLIKAVAGGGGKGMRLVERAGDFPAALESARGEAATAFGNPAVLIEKYIQQPRHIEVQVFGDGTRAVHLFERDCSLQRRHQKVIEEAPAPGMTPQMRDAMGAAAVRAAEAIGYAGAGTIEFIVDGSQGLRPDGFWFMEMNTRLQVEHPVTELITGVDLVEWQLRVASGEPLPASQDQLTITGHAFEARLYAEDVPAGFLPATGTLAHLAFPEHARIETGVRKGDVISPWYDPMIAKIVTHGATRAIALRELEAALEDTEVAGSVTNVDFLIALTRHPGFVRGEVDTGLIGRDLDSLVEAAAPDPGSRALGVLGLAGLDDPAKRGGVTLWQPLRRTIAWDGGEAVLEVLGPGAARVTLDERTHQIGYEGGRWWVDGRPRRWRIVNHAAGSSVFGGRSLTLVPLDPLARGGAETGGGLTLSPMPGLVKAVFVSAGQEVAAGDRLAVLEAMKMEHTLTAARDGRVAEVLAQAGDQVEAGAPLIRLEDEDG
ncbi:MULTISPECIES: acetyl-CoA carboxylase biotin carboxylase subunit [unclassified Paracoccus (in: a-proteobacteria)]|uniref:acetyl-CoA carboxylase biotin carboxylase subunit n=1 Tax=unclassified Paracoccus (in: a-proteobacteria) TaxID=2688777 RepID=UPI0012B237CA|nr:MULTISPECIES: acetyl/propionyl/methylcrotonyl-CoA carboxylase subunit alpha [unclassified Paracoccus (in: a-proteobacteria)]UXU74729.1 acetyl/propionyl/methylcrotonyl-CoA carboxylase subunit alpha [Paracoccus sp. SMMA_5]UXU80625.1 acetyl/propionyl/methylcrotonyl-CoA carboxylase subunit alpha [Paracoccus sp. SMMA_5_TC]